MRTIIKNARIVLPDGVQEGFVTVEGAVIAGIGSGRPDTGSSADLVIDAGQRYLSPGFFDLHAHGAGGCDFMDGTPESFITAGKTHLRHGTTSLLPTTVAASQETTEKCIDSFKTAKQTMKDGPDLIGLHMEGPYLNAEYKGAIDERYIIAPNAKQYREYVKRGEGGIVRWTAAPELEGALDMGDWLAAHDILPSIGHSGAEYACVLEAFRHGFTHITHLYSAMSTIVRKGGFRYSGVLESAFIIDGMSVEIIADGCHIPMELLRFVYKCKGAGSTCLISDSMRSAGTCVTESTLGGSGDGIKVIIEDGVAKLPDRSAFAGSIATDDRLVRVMLQAGVPLVDCIEMMCHTPAKIMKRDNRKGSIAIGKDADLVLFDSDISVTWVMAGGRVIIE